MSDINPSSLTLPALRDDLRLIEGAPLVNGEPAWLIHDPLRGRFFQIDRLAVTLLANWQPGPVEQFITPERRFAPDLTDEQLVTEARQLTNFLYANSLTDRPVGEDARNLAAQAAAGKAGWLKWLVHNYLFMRLPLLRPQAMLERITPGFAIVFQPWFWTLIGLLGGLGLLLVLRQWDEFLGTFPRFFSAEGLMLYLFGLVLAKTLHEMGHAITATRHGCTVPTMGVAFLVGMPMLYTDVSDAWRLKSRRARLMIDLAGVLAELVLAVIALWLWLLLPDGPVRSMSFVLATTSLALTLLVNLNPFMRFDGYYVLSDYLGLPNLQQRSFAFGKWALREILFRPRHPAPERVSRSMKRTLIFYAWFTWQYRFFLFLGIALLVYAFFFKILGLILFAIELLWFILFPVLNEVKLWWSMRNKLKQTRRSKLLLVSLVLMTALFILPWQSRVSGPALLTPASMVQLYPPRPGQLKAIYVRENQPVDQGAPIFRLASPELDEQIRRTRLRLSLLRRRLNRIIADKLDRSQYLVLRNEIRLETNRLGGLMKQRGELTLRAPMPGMIAAVNRSAGSAQWVNEATHIADLVTPGRYRITAWLGARDMRRITAGATGTFIAEIPELPHIQVKVVSVGRTGIEQLPYKSLASRYGGPIAVQPGKQNETLKPADALFEVVLEPLDPAQSRQLATAMARLPLNLRGTVLLTGTRISPARIIMERMASILIRESGF